MADTARNCSKTENHKGPRSKYDPSTHNRFEVAETAGKGGVRGEIWVPKTTTISASDTFTLTVV